MMRAPARLAHEIVHGPPNPNPNPNPDPNPSPSPKPDPNQVPGGAALRLHGMASLSACFDDGAAPLLRFRWGLGLELGLGLGLG